MEDVIRAALDKAQLLSSLEEVRDMVVVMIKEEVARIDEMAESLLPFFDDSEEKATTAAVYIQIALLGMAFTTAANRPTTMNGQDMKQLADCFNEAVAKRTFVQNSTTRSN